MRYVWCRKAAFNVAVGGWIPCGICFAFIALFLAKEEDALQVGVLVHLASLGLIF